MIDHLPRNSYYSQLVANDEEHTRMLLKAREGQETDYAPPMATWSAEAELLATVVDRLGGVTYAIQKTNNPKANIPPPKPYPRPRTASEKVKAKVRRQKHEALAARILPHKRS